MKSCIRCSIEKNEEFFSIDGRSGERHNFCKVCQNKGNKESYYKHYDKRRLTFRAYILRKYKLTINDYDRMFLEQQGQCKICKSTNPGKLKIVFCVDHCHKTGKIRGLLCQTCNRGLGLFGDNHELVKIAYEYLHQALGV